MDGFIQLVAMILEADRGAAGAVFSGCRLSIVKIMICHRMNSRVKNNRGGWSWRTARDDVE